MKKLVVIREQYLDNFLGFSNSTGDQYLLLIINKERRLPSAVNLLLYTNNCVVLAILSENTVVSAKAFAKFSLTFLVDLNCELPMYYYDFNKEVLTNLIFRKKLKTDSPLSVVYLPPLIKQKIIFYKWLWKLREHISKVRTKFL